MKYVTAFLFVGILALGVASSAYADGDKVHGDIAEGPACQLGEVPFIG